MSSFYIALTRSSKVWTYFSDLEKYLTSQGHRNAYQIVCELYRYLLLVVRLQNDNKKLGSFPKNLISPSLVIDEAWHSFILMTEQYREFQKALGIDIDHDLLATADPEVLKDSRRAVARALYVVVFGAEPPADIWMTKKRWRSTETLIFVETLTLKKFELHVDLHDDTVKELKELIQEKEGIPPDQQLLVFAGKELKDDRTLESYQILPKSTLVVILKLRGC